MSKLSKETAEAVTKVMRAAGMPPVGELLGVRQVGNQWRVSWSDAYQDSFLFDSKRTQHERAILQRAADETAGKGREVTLPAQPMGAGKSLTALKYLLGYDPELDAIDVAAQRLRRSQRRLRDAMEGMSNVAACMFGALTFKAWNGYARKLIADAPRVLAEAIEKDRAAYYARWSAEVNRKVAALPPPGPRVYCANEDD